MAAPTLNHTIILMSFKVRTVDTAIKSVTIRSQLRTIHFSIIIRYRIYFIPSSEFNAYQKQIKFILSAVKKYRFFFTSDENDLYFFTVANRGCFGNVGFIFFQKKSGMYRSCLTLRYGSRHVK